MTYQVQFTDSTNPNKPPITVADGTVNTSSTSLGFVGQGYPGYGPIIADDLLHLLENFAAPTSPPNPVQGQLWYDTSTNILKVYDSTSWTTAGSLKKSTSAPAVANSIAGDLWANTTTSQLYLFTGSNWVLVGPQFSAGTQTGPTVEAIIDTNNLSHNVITMYANNNRIAIISKEKFIPKSAIAGFSIVNEGINLSTIDASSTTSPTKFWGVAEKADSLLINGSAVSSSNFLRSDVSSTTNYSLNVRTDSGIVIGSNLGFTVDIENGSPTLKSTNSGASVNVTLTDVSGVLTTVLHVDASGKVGIGTNNVAPRSTLDVSGLITADTGLHIIGTTDAAYTTGTLFTTATGSIVTQGGMTVAKKSVFGDDITSYGQYNINYVDNTNTPIAAAVLLPGYSTDSNEATTLNIPLVSAGQYDIGSATRPFRNLYGSNFVGNFSGTFTGTLEGSASGSAAALQSSTVFSLAGDVSSNSISFNGQTETGTAVFNTTINPSFITTNSDGTPRTVATDSFVTDTLLVYRTNVGLVQMPKSTLLQHVPVLPIGSILPFAGTVVPTGYLLCDGGEVLISTYSQLYSVIGYSYKNPAYLLGAGTFAVPDLRGRFPLGADNMNNNITVPSSDGSGTQISTTKDINGNHSLVAHRVNDITASNIGSGNVAATGYVSLTSSNLPDHSHTLNDGNAQYYAVSAPGSASDPNAIFGYGLVAGSTGSGLPNSGPVQGATNIAVNVMNPYQTINYIIFTGNI